MSRKFFRRAYRQLGIRPFALPCIALLGVAVVFDRFSDDYLEQLGRVDDQARTLDVQSAKLDQAERVEAIHAQLVPRSRQVSGQLIDAADVPQALAALQTRVQAALAAAYVQGASVTPVAPDSDAVDGVLGVDVTFAAVPQQLPRLEQALLGADRLLRIGSIDIRVRTSASGGQELMVQARVIAPYRIVVELQAKDGGKTAKPGGR